MPKISIVIPCFNEERNIPELYERLDSVLTALSDYTFEIIFIDNNSTDNSQNLLRTLAKNDSRVKAIFNLRNFGHIRSPYWALLESQGSAVICMAADLQCPPELLPKLIKEWELGWKVVFGVKPKSKTNVIMRNLRKLYYRFLTLISETTVVQNATGFGLYDKEVIDHLKSISDPYPYVRGLVSELGYPIKEIEFIEPRRIYGSSNVNFYLLYDIAMLGIVSSSVLPLRFAIFTGALLATASFFTSIYYLINKLLYWDTFQLGLAPLTVGLFFTFGMLFIFLGILGEYIISIQRFLKNRPIIVERERINFD